MVLQGRLDTTGADARNQVLYARGVKRPDHVRGVKLAVQQEQAGFYARIMDLFDDLTHKNGIQSAASCSGQQDSAAIQR